MKSARPMVKVFMSIIVFLVISTLSEMCFAEQLETISGRVVNSEEGIIIEADDGDYLTQGMDLSHMLGKVVEVTGTVIETDQGYVIDVKTAEELEE
jgi:hypothetical protein